MRVKSWLASLCYFLETVDLDAKNYGTVHGFVLCHLDTLLPRGQDDSN